MERSPVPATENESQTQFSIQSNWHFWRLYTNRSPPISLNIQSIFKVIKYWTRFNKYNQVNQDFDWWLWVHKKLVKRVMPLGLILILCLLPLFLKECRNCVIFVCAGGCFSCVGVCVGVLGCHLPVICASGRIVVCGYICRCVWCILHQCMFYQQM